MKLLARSRKPFLKLDKKQIAAVVQSTAPAVGAVARNVASSVDHWDHPVNVYDTKNEKGRPVSLVVLSHPSALAAQAKYGVLTRAAAKQGLDVHRW